MPPVCAVTGSASFSAASVDSSSGGEYCVARSAADSGAGYDSVVVSSGGYESVSSEDSYVCAAAVSDGCSEWIYAGADAASSDSRDYGANDVDCASA